MIKESRGRTRYISVCSILTIIILVLVSGGCALTPKEWRLQKSTCKEAGLLVTLESIKVRNGTESQAGWRGADLTGINDTETTNSLYTLFAELDGVATKKSPVGVHPKSMELCPGHHTYRFGVVGDPYEMTKGGELEVEPHGVYVLIVTLDYRRHGVISVRVKGDTMKWRTVRTEHTYDQTTGIATHPTDSNLSFRVK